MYVKIQRRFVGLWSRANTWVGPVLLLRNKATLYTIKKNSSSQPSARPAIGASNLKVVCRPSIAIVPPRVYRPRTCSTRLGLGPLCGVPSQLSVSTRPRRLRRRRHEHHIYSFFSAGGMRYVNTPISYFLSSTSGLRRRKMIFYVILHMNT